MGHSQPVQELSGVRTWVNDSRENTPAPSPSREDYADGQPKRDRVLPLPSGHPEGRTEQRAGPPVSNTPSDSSGASTSYSKAPNPNAIPNQPDGKPLHQRPRSSGLPGDQYGHPYIDQSTSTGLKRRVALDALMGEVLDPYLEDEDFIYDVDENGDLFKSAFISVKIPSKRQRKQKGQARREYKKWRIKNRLKNKTKLKTKRRRYYLKNRSRIKRYNQKRRKHLNRFKRYEGGGVSTVRQKNRRSRKALDIGVNDMGYYDIDRQGNLSHNGSKEFFKVRSKKASSNKIRYASADVKLEIMQTLLAVLRAVHWSHWTSHWQVKGLSSYGDHQLMERLYESLEDEIDTLAEKIVGEYGPVAVAPVPQAQQSIQVLIHNDATDPITRALIAEERIQPILKRVYDMIKDNGGMSLGLDDFIMSIANAHETNLYLLRQRKRS